MPNTVPPPSTSLGLGRVSASPEEAEAYFRQRLRAFLGLFALVWWLFFLMQLGLRLFVDPRLMLNFERVDVTALHAGCATALSLGWVVLSRHPISFAVLGKLEVAATLLQIFCLCALIAIAGIPEFRSELSAVLGLTNLLAVRAALIPSSTRRTAIVGFVGSVPLPIATYWIYATRPSPETLAGPAALAVFAATWTIFSIVASVTISHVIYGLEQRVQAATTLGQYTLEEPIGEGSMGQVFRAKHALLRRPTAVKLLPPDKAGKDSIKRFEREVQLTSSLSHPNIVAIYDYGQTPDGVFYYAMEFLEGTDLEKLVKTLGPLPPGRVRHIVRQIADALAEAHAIQLIHRDIKPANVVLLNRGRQHDVVKVCDFGLVKDLRPDPAAPSASSVTALVGTPLYVSPESITDPKKVDARSDLYALGAVAYFLLTGTPWIKGKNLVEVCAAHLYETPEPPSKRLGKPVPESLERLVLRCLEKDPKKRPRDAAEIVDALDRATDIEPWTFDAPEDEPPKSERLNLGRSMKIDLTNRG
jgi:serine/threonine-protein kinase